MEIFQKEFYLKARPKGFHLVTNEILQELPELKNFSSGIANIFIKHTSASLTINENADPDVRQDMKSFTDKMVPENLPYFVHTMEGPDDMPAHIKSSLFGSSINIPLTNGNLNLGTWQGIYLCEHRNNGGRRKIVVTIIGN
ncbi:MAG TPA: secondary thiamine-phosphate synthase enzyme YjbQ [Ignavibacteriaceae bacterium]|nr:secondary thiamine-phosphate synthase enzyme YjbQ [Ignavibacteriaceae bacterium]